MSVFMYQTTWRHVPNHSNLLPVASKVIRGTDRQATKHGTISLHFLAKDSKLKRIGVEMEIVCPVFLCSHFCCRVKGSKKKVRKAFCLGAHVETDQIIVLR